VKVKFTSPKTGLTYKEERLTYEKVSLISEELNLELAKIKLNSSQSEPDFSP
jgi:hypothetical protein